MAIFGSCRGTLHACLGWVHGQRFLNLTETILRDPDRFERAELNVIDQIRRRLRILRSNEERLERSIDPIEFESQLEYILGHWRAKKVDLHGICDCFDNFNQEQLKDLYELFLMIEEWIPWERIDWMQVFRASRSQK